MAHSFSSLYKNIMAWVSWATPHYFRFLYYFSMPTIVVLGLMSKPRSPIVDGALDFMFGSSAPQPMYGGYGGPNY